MHAALQLAKKCMAAAQDRQRIYADKSRRDASFQLGDTVLLNTKNLGLKPSGCRKLWPRYLGPFPITKVVGEVAYELELPTSMSRVHKVFHVSLLKGYKAGDRVPPPPPPVEMADDDLEWEVEAVLAERGTKHKQYLVKWTDYGQEHNTWEPANNLTNCSEALADFKRGRNELPPKRTSALKKRQRG